MHRSPGYLRPIRWGALFVLGSLAVILAPPAHAYVGNYEFLYWGARRKLVLGDFGGSESLFKQGISEEEKWWGRLENRQGHIQRHEATSPSGENICDLDLKYLALRMDFYSRRMQWAEAEVAELKKPDEGAIRLTIEERRLAYVHEKQAFGLEVHAAELEQNAHKYPEGRAVRQQAIDARKAGCEALRKRIEELSSAKEKPADLDLRLAYLKSELKRFEDLATNLQAEQDFAADPEKLAGRMRFFELKAPLYDGMYKRVYLKLAEHFRQKALLACELAGRDPARKTGVAELRRQLEAKQTPKAAPLVPTWYYPVEYELPLFDDPLGAPENFTPLKPAHSQKGKQPKPSTKKPAKDSAKPAKEKAKPGKEPAKPAKGKAKPEKETAKPREKGGKQPETSGEPPKEPARKQRDPAQDEARARRWQ